MVITQDYRGSAPFSEPEVAAMRDFVAAHQFTVALNIHSFGRFVNVPYATNKKGLPPQPQLDIFNSLATDMTAVNHWRFGQAWSEVSRTVAAARVSSVPARSALAGCTSQESLYTVNGEASDWMFDKHGIYAYSPEVGPEFEREPFSAGFWPRTSELEGLAEEVFDLQLVAAWAAGPHVQGSVTSASVAASSVPHADGRRLACIAPVVM